MKNLRNKNQPPRTDLVQNYLESSWDIVTDVYAQLDDIQTVADQINGGGLSFLLPEDIDTLPELNANFSDGTVLGNASDFATAAQGAKVDLLTVTQAVDLDAMEIRVNELDSAIVLQGSWDASAGTFPGGGTAQAGHTWVVSVGGTVDGVVFNVNDRILALTDDASTTTYAGQWLIQDYTDQVISVAGLTGAITDIALRAALNVQDGATDDQTGAEIKAALFAEADTNNLTDTLKDKLDNIEPNATADQTDAEIEAAYNTQVPQVSPAERTAGTELAIRRYSPADIASMALAHGPGGGTNAALNKVIAGTTYTILEADNGYNLFFTNAAAIAVTLPDTLSTNFQCAIIQTTAAGIPTVTPNTDTINGAGTGVAPAEQWKALYLNQFQATEWIAVL